MKRLIWPLLATALVLVTACAGNGSADEPDASTGGDTDTDSDADGDGDGDSDADGDGDSDADADTDPDGTTYHVDAAHALASDDNPGTAELPLLTIQEGLDRALAGDTVSIAAGVYRESLELPRSGAGPGAPITIRGEPGADVRVKGSDVVSGWVAHSESIWKKTGWGVNSQQVFVDGAPLEQIGAASPFHECEIPLDIDGDGEIDEGVYYLPAQGAGIDDMFPGSFWYDAGEESLYVWLAEGSDDDIGAHLVEASTRLYVIAPIERDFIAIEDLGFAHSNLTSFEPPDAECGIPGAMVNVIGSGWVVSGCVFEHADFAGLNVAGEDHLIADSVFNHNGCQGILIQGSDEEHAWQPYADRPPQNILLTGNETSHNNTRGFSKEWGAGGIKAANACNGVAIEDHVAVGEAGEEIRNGPGIWFDIYCRNVEVTRSRFDGNSIGILFEISGGACFSNSLFLHNGVGIAVSTSDGASVVNNTMHDNTFGIMLGGIGRVEDPPPGIEMPALVDSEVGNNVISQSGLCNLWLEGTAEEQTANDSDHNLFVDADGLARVCWNGEAINTLAECQSELGKEASSILETSLWQDVEDTDFALPAGASAIDRGGDLEGIGSVDILGNPRVVDGDGDDIPEVDIGAFEHQ